MFHATASRLAAVTLSGVALAFLAFAASGAPQATASGLSSFQDDEAGYLGVSLGDEGLSVSEVTPGTAAAAAGLQPGDRIVWIADRDVETYEQLVAVLKRNPPGSEVGIVYLRGDQVLKKKLVLGSRSKPKLERVEEEGEHDQAQVQDEREVLRRVLEEFEGQEGAARAPGFLGINLGDGEGVVVGSVVPGTAAERGKLQAGDRLVALDDTKIGSLADLRKALAARPAGTKVVVTVQRGDMLLRSAVQLGRADGEEAVAPDQPGDEMRQHIEEQLRRAVEGLPRRDVAVIDQPGFLGVYLDEAQEGAVVSGIVPGSAAEKAKLQPGDRILALGDRKISSTDELRAAIAARAAGSRVGLRLVRGDQVIGPGRRIATATSSSASCASSRRRARSNPAGGRGRTTSGWESSAASCASNPRTSSAPSRACAGVPAASSSTARPASGFARSCSAGARTARGCCARTVPGSARWKSSASSTWARSCAACAKGPEPRPGSACATPAAASPRPRRESGRSSGATWPPRGAPPSRRCVRPSALSARRWRACGPNSRTSAAPSARSSPDGSPPGDATTKRARFASPPHARRGARIEPASRCWRRGWRRGSALLALAPGVQPARRVPLVQDGGDGAEGLALGR